MKIHGYFYESSGEHVIFYEELKHHIYLPKDEIEPGTKHLIYLPKDEIEPGTKHLMYGDVNPEWKFLAEPFWEYFIRTEKVPLENSVDEYKRFKRGVRA